MCLVLQKTQREEINLFYIVIVRKSESIIKVLNIAKQLYTDLIGNLKWS